MGSSITPSILYTVKNHSTWRVASGSVQGVSHIRSNQPCQDAVVWAVHDDCLMVVMADGAGSAAFSERGSELACEAALSELKKTIPNLKDWKETEWKAAFTAVAEKARAAVVDEAAKEGRPVKAYASTIIILAATPSRAAALQIGDGAAVILDFNDQMRCLTAPLESEYLNETVFLTGEKAIETAQFNMIEVPLKAAAALTDGLQMLALKMPGGTPHAPFFHPLFQFTAAESDQLVRDEKLAGWLRSPRISQRADDDLTLLLAALDGLPQTENKSS
ncbi:MAG: PP2C family serine/threonine-protein phosphatase [Verrucomicrobiales bacterium]